MTVEIELPRLAGVREAAARLVGGISPQLDAQTVVLNARLLITGTPSFADELVVRLKAAGVDGVELIAAPDDFTQLMTRAARTHGIDSFTVVQAPTTQALERA